MNQRIGHIRKRFEHLKNQFLVFKRGVWGFQDAEKYVGNEHFEFRFQMIFEVKKQDVKDPKRHIHHLRDIRDAVLQQRLAQVGTDKVDELVSGTKADARVFEDGKNELE